MAGPERGRIYGLRNMLEASGLPPQLLLSAIERSLNDVLFLVMTSFQAQTISLFMMETLISRPPNGINVLREKVGMVGGVFLLYTRIRSNCVILYDSFSVLAILQIFREKVGMVGGVFLLYTRISNTSTTVELYTIAIGLRLAAKVLMLLLFVKEGKHMYSWLCQQQQQQQQQ
uniref:Uncharacterized protein n=1 Tax=Glossina pallidipes TaxID=7398 RepID=A0A1A9ZAF0_GLOPL